MENKKNISLFFGGTAYLGIPHNDEFRKLFIRGMEIYGVNHGASRNNNITLDIFSIDVKKKNESNNIICGG